ncbi:hypothetical protein [Sphingomonas sp.]|uniref:hypothetical protein n=1 Tax=Sphingomonas sp. TaxID=28214 RepID=UPI003B00A388
MPTITLMVWRASLATARPVPDATDLDDWAVILAEAGEAGAAALLRDAAAISRGLPAPATPVATPRRAIDILFAELDTLAAGFAPRATPPAPRRFSGRPDEAAGIGPSIPPPSPPADLAAAGAGLRAFLSAPAPDDAQAARAAATLAGLVEAHARLPDLDYRMLRDAPLDELAFAIALTALGDFALAVRDLATPPLGSIRLLHRVARLDADGLGPYLSAVRRVAQRGTDIFEFARRAAGDAGEDDAFEAWIALLARECPEPLLLDVIDDLGDANRSAVLHLILDRVLSRFAGVELDVVRRVRDAGLDNGDWRLAARAQAAITRLRPRDHHELVILGSIEATAGDFEAAEMTFVECLRRSPQDEDAAVRLLAARRHRFEGLEVLGGYGAPPVRTEARLRRRSIIPPYPTRRGERLFTVDV